MPEQVVNPVPNSTLPVLPAATPTPVQPSNRRFKLFLALGIALLVLGLAIFAIWQLTLNQPSANATDTTTEADSTTEEDTTSDTPKIQLPRRIAYTVKNGSTDYKVHLTDLEVSTDEIIYTGSGFNQAVGWNDENTLVIWESQTEGSVSTYSVKTLDLETQEINLISSDTHYDNIDQVYYEQIGSEIYTDRVSSPSDAYTTHNLYMKIGSEYQEVYSWGEVGGFGPGIDSSLGAGKKSPDGKHYVSLFNGPLADTSKMTLLVLDDLGNIVDSFRDPFMSNVNFVSNAEIIYKTNTSESSDAPEYNLIRYNFLTKTSQVVGGFGYLQSQTNLDAGTIIANKYYDYELQQVPDTLVLDLETLVVKETFAGSLVWQVLDAGSFITSDMIYSSEGGPFPYDVISYSVVKDGVKTKLLDTDPMLTTVIQVEPDWDE
jgi:hypothetical protein